jgi:hypothetical protein
LFCIFAQVSWIRRKDLHVLSMDDKIFSSDSRIVVSRSVWTSKGDGNGRATVKGRKHKNLDDVDEGSVNGTDDADVDADFAAPPGKEVIEWALKIAQVDTTDTGIYECQLNTEPKLSSTVTLNVVREFNHACPCISDVLYIGYSFTPL